MSRVVFNQATVQRAVTLLKQGHLVAFPTETVYALAGDVSNPLAVERLFKAKGRPKDKPLVVLLAEGQQVMAWARHISIDAWKLAHQFWPGPLTLILACSTRVLPSLIAGQTTIGLRVPNHPVAQALLKTFTGALAATSANRSGYTSPTSAWHVQQALGHAVDLIVDGGICPIGIESTIVDVTGVIPHILRLGAISAQQIQALLTKPVTVGNT